MDEEEMQENNDTMQTLEDEGKEKIADVKEDVQDAKDAAKIAAKAAAGDEAGAIKDTAQLAARKLANPKKLLKKMAITTVKPIIIFALVIGIIAVIFYGAVTETSRILRGVIDDFGDTIQSWVTSEGINVNDDELDEFLMTLKKEHNIDLADMGFGADYEDMKDDEEYKNASPEERVRMQARHYIKKFFQASLVTQNFNTNNVTDSNAVPGGIVLERHDAETGRKTTLSYTDGLDPSDYEHFTLDDDGKAMFYGKDGIPRTIDPTNYEQYSVPVMYFIDLCLTTQNPKYVGAIADGIIEGAMSGGNSLSGTGGNIIETGDMDVDGFTNRIEINGVQYTEYKQNSARWANEPYSAMGNGSGTISSSGCGPTSVAVILSGFKQYQNVTPVDTASGMSKTWWTTISARLSDYGINNTVYESYSSVDIRSLLSDGKPLICSFGPTYLSTGLRFTGGDHISVILGLNETRRPSVCI